MQKCQCWRHLEGNENAQLLSLHAFMFTLLFALSFNCLQKSAANLFLYKVKDWIFLCVILKKCIKGFFFLNLNPVTKFYLIL